MRILTVVSNLDVGGAQGSAKNASLAFMEQGQQVAVLAYRGGGPRVQPMREAGLEIFVGGKQPAEFDCALSAAAAWKPNVLHVHRAGHADEDIAQLIRSLRHRSSKRLAVLETNIFGRVDASDEGAGIDVHLLLTRYCLWKWRKWSKHIRPSPIGAVVPNIVRNDGFFPAGDDIRNAFRTEHGIPKDAVVFGRVGQPIRAKWSHAAFEAFSRFATQRADAWFVAVGLPKAYPKYLRTLPADVQRRIVVIDFLHGEEALRACYAGLDVFLHSARIGESFGLVLAEAMLCERPVITLSTPARDNSQCEVVGHERGGLVAANVAAMVDAMHRLAGDAHLRARLGTQGRQWCLEHYDSPMVGKMMVRIAEHALKHVDRAKLAAVLRSDPMIETEVSNEEIEDLLQRQIGQPSVMERLQMRLVHSPSLYAWWRLIRRAHRRLRGPGDKKRMIQEREAKQRAAQMMK